MTVLLLVAAYFLTGFLFAVWAERLPGRSQTGVVVCVVTTLWPAIPLLLGIGFVFDKIESAVRYVASK